MNRADLLNDKAFWAVLETLLAKDSTYSFSELHDDFGLANDEIMALSSFLKNLGVDISVSGEKVKIQGISDFQWKMSLLDWIAFQVHFPFLSEHNTAPYHKFLKSFLSKQEKKLQTHDFFEAFSTLEQSFQASASKLVQPLELAILAKSALRVKLRGGDRNFFCYPYRLSYLQDELHLISEDSHDKTLLTIPLNQIADIKVADEGIRPHHGASEIASFISNLRQFSETEEHLVLKIYQPDDQLNLSPDYHFFRNASLLRSSRGDYIWSAYVEPGERLYEWLEELWKGCQFDILSPNSIADEFDEFLYLKMSKVA